MKSELFVKMRNMRSNAAVAQECPGETGFTFGHFFLDPNAKILWRDGEVLPLGPKVVYTLAILVSRQEQVVSRAELIHQVWGDTAVEDNSLAHNISVLRKVLKEDPAETFAIETVPRRGYRFYELGRTKQACGIVGETGAHVAAGNRRLPRLRGGWFQLAMVSGLLLGLGAVTVFLTGYRLSGKVRSRRSVAVIGFVNLAHQPDEAWISPALSEMMGTELAAGGKLLTIPDESVARARTELKLEDQDGFSAETLSRLRRNLGADVVVSGAYAVLQPAGGLLSETSPSSGGKVRLDLRVQDTRTGEVTDAVTETGDQANLFDLVARAGMRVRQDLGVEMPAPEEAKQASASVSSNPQALQLYAEGTEKLRRFDALDARALLQRAVQIDANYALAHSALAEALGVLGYDTQSREEAKTAFELSGNLSREEQLWIEGRYRMATRERTRAVEVYKQLAGLFPDNLDYGLQLASAQIATSATGDALATLRTLRRLPQPAGGDPRISLKEYEIWKTLSDFKRVDTSLAEAAEAAQKQGAWLLLARTKVRQCWVRRKLAEKQLAQQDCNEARQIYASAGDRRGESDALRLLGDLASESDAKAAMSYYRQSLALQQEIGHLEGQAGLMNQLAIQYSNQGDHVAAKNSYEQALEIFRRLDSRPDSIGILLNVGYESAALSETEEARRIYDEALNLAAKAGDKDIEALAEYDIGLLHQLEGDVAAAHHSYKRALAWFQESNDKTYAAGVMNTMGEVAMWEGDLKGARKLFEEAHAIEQGSQQQVLAAESEMNLAKLSLEEHACSSEMSGSVSQLRTKFRDGGMINDEAQAVALLARCLLSSGQPAAALNAIEESVELSAKAEPGTRLSIAISAARVRFAVQGHSTRTQALETLQRTIAEAHKFGYASVELDARLALGEIELKSGATARGRNDLQAVGRDAARRGLVLLAHKAGAA